MKKWPYSVRVIIGILLMIASMILLWYPILCKGETYAMTTIVVSSDYNNN